MSIHDDFSSGRLTSCTYVMIHLVYSSAHVCDGLSQHDDFVVVTGMRSTAQQQSYSDGSRWREELLHNIPAIP